MRRRPFFFGRHEGKLETFAKICVVVSLETLREDPTVRIRDKRAAWKLLSKISRTAPDFVLIQVAVIIYTMVASTYYIAIGVMKVLRYWPEIITPKPVRYLLFDTGSIG